MHTVRLVPICLCVVATFCLAQPAAPIATIPLDPYLRAQAVVHATVNGQPGVFLFDTGSGVSNLTPAFMKKIDCHPWGRLTGFRMTGERLDNPHCDNLTIEFSGRRLTASVVSAADVMTLLGPGVPPIDGTIGLDVFADRVVTIILRKGIILESEASLAGRVADARELPIRIVRDVEGAALSVDAAVRTPNGAAWMELDSGNGGSLVVANHISSLLGLRPDIATPTPARFELANGIAVEGMTRTRDLIMDGDIGAQFLNNWILTLDLLHRRAWMSPVTATRQ